MQVVSYIDPTGYVLMTLRNTVRMATTPKLQETGRVLTLGLSF